MSCKFTDLRALNTSLVVSDIELSLLSGVVGVESVKRSVNLSRVLKMDWKKEL